MTISDLIDQNLQTMNIVGKKGVNMQILLTMQQEFADT